MIRMDQINLQNKRVLIRADLNVPMQNGKILDETRLIAELPTLKQALKAEACVLLISHLGRPKEGHYSEEFSLQPIANRLSELLNKPVRFEKEWLNSNFTLSPGEIVLCENVRFNVGEESNDETLAKRMAALCDIFIMDAFATAHRVQASTVGVAKFAPIAAAGPLLSKEIEALSKVLGSPQKPLVAIVGGAKVSSKLLVLKSLIQKVDTLIVGGGIANTFLVAEGYSMGDSLFEPDLVATARELLKLAKDRGVTIVVPIDGIVAKEISENAEKRITDFSDIQPTEKILDVGPKTSERYDALLKNAGTILWNGPVGVFELEAFGEGTKQLAKAIANAKAFSIAGGGETVAAIEKYRVSKKISYISTGGGAFLEMLEGKTLPAVAILEERAKNL